MAGRAERPRAFVQRFLNETGQKGVIMSLGMGLFHRISAAWFALLVANPLCCCFTPASASELTESSKVPSCCSQTQATQAEHGEGSDEAPCSGCQVRNPRLADGGKAFVLAPDVLAPVTLLSFVAVPPLSVEVALSRPAPADPDPGPPRRGLALRQSFLI